MSALNRLIYRIRLAAAPLAIAGIATPLTAYAQSISPEQALLNPLPAAYRILVSDTTAAPIDGERALLGRSAADVAAAPKLAASPSRESAIVTGEQALLGRTAPSVRRRLTLKW